MRKRETTTAVEMRCLAAENAALRDLIAAISQAIESFDGDCPRRLGAVRGLIGRWQDQQARERGERAT